jgi:hypothetical protein
MVYLEDSGSDLRKHLAEKLMESNCWWCYVLDEASTMTSFRFDIISCLHLLLAPISFCYMAYILLLRWGDLRCQRGPLQHTEPSGFSYSSGDSFDAGHFEKNHKAGLV